MTEREHICFSFALLWMHSLPDYDYACIDGTRQWDIREAQGSYDRRRHADEQAACA